MRAKAVCLLEEARGGAAAFGKTGAVQSGL